MNAVELDDISGLCERIEKASITKLYPLKVEIEQTDGTKTTLHAINEATLQRQSHQYVNFLLLLTARLDLLI